MSATPRIGDRVRLTHEGVVSYVDADGIVELDGAWRRYPRTASVEILEAAPPAVGDVLTGPELVARAPGLPVGTYVRVRPSRSTSGATYWTHAYAGWRSTIGSHGLTSLIDRPIFEIVHIPEVTE